MPVFPDRLGRLSTPGFRYLAARAGLPQTATLLARWSADDIPAQADNTPLATWTDSVAGIVATASNTGPRYRTSQLGGKPGVQFAASGAFNAGRPASFVTAVDTSKAYTMIVVASQIGGGGSGAKILGGFSNASSAIFNANGGRAGLFGSVNTDYPYTSSAPLVLGFVQYPSSTALASVSTSSLIYLNGGAVSGSIGYTSNGANFGIGGFDTGNYASTCVIHEVLFWNRSLTPAEMLQVQKWFCDKYGQAYPWAASGKFDIFHGDSLTFGQSRDANEYSYPSYVASLNARPLGAWTNLGFPGTTWTQLDTVTGAFVDAIPGVLGAGVQARVACFEWYNQQSADGVATRTAANAYRANRKAANPSLKIVFGTSTDTTAAGASTAGRTAYDSYYDTPANQANIDAYVPIHANANIGVDGASASTTYFNPDKVHMTGKAGYPTTPSGYGTLAGLYAPALAGL